MNFFPSSDEEELRIAAERYISANLSLQGARAGNIDARAGLAEMGFFGITLDEASGGLDLSHAAELLVFAEMGRALAPIGAIASAVAAPLAAKASNAALAGEIAAGRPVALALAAGDRIRLLDPVGADLALLVEDDNAQLFALPALDAINDSLDVTTRQAVVDRAAVSTLASEQGGRARNHLQILASAYALGSAAAARDLGASYALTRVQFGRPIGSFQGIKHPCADMQVRCSVALAQTCYAACAVDGGHPDQDFLVAAARKLAGNAALENGRTLIQVHGGMGMTDECDAHLFLKRAHLLQFLLPSSRATLLADFRAAA